MSRWAGGNYAQTYANFPVASTSLLKDVVNPATVACETCHAKVGQRCERLPLGREYHHLRWLAALVDGR